MLSCRAWKDPALDRLWEHLDGMHAVLTVLRTCEELIPEDALSRVLQYTVRVRSIMHFRSESTVPSALQYCAVLFPRLESVTLFSEGCMVPYALACSPSLKNVTISSPGYPAYRRAVSEQRSNAAGLLLHHALVQAPHIRTLRIHDKGLISANLNNAIASCAQLRALYIRASSLVIETFAAVAAFPHLELLDLWVPLRSDELRSGVQPSPTIFPALRDLTIHGYGPVLEAILALLPVGVLTKVHLDLQAMRPWSAEGPTRMNDVLKCLAEKTSDSLTELQMEDRTRTDGLQASPEVTRSYDLILLRPLARLKKLRRFTLSDPDFTDADLRVIAKWWPFLEHLDLGSYDPKDVVPERKARLTSAAHSIAISSFPHLSTIKLPVAMSSPESPVCPGPT